MIYLAQSDTTAGLLSQDKANGMNELYFCSKRILSVLNIKNRDACRYVERFSVDLYDRLMVSINADSISNLVLN